MPLKNKGEGESPSPMIFDFGLFPQKGEFIWPSWKARTSYYAANTYLIIRNACTQGQDSNIHFTLQVKV